MSEEEIREVLESVAPLLVDGSPHAVALGLKIDQLEPDCIIMRAPYSPDLVGDPETGILHGGVVTALLDHACGLAAFAGLGAQDTPATLDLRIDYMRPAQPGLDVIAEASTVRAYGLVVFVRSTAHDGDRDDPVAIAQAAFMVTKASQAATERAKKAFGQGETK